MTVTLLNKHSLKSRVLNTLLKFLITVLKPSQEKIFILESFKLHVFVKTWWRTFHVKKLALLFYKLEYGQFPTVYLVQMVLFKQ